MPKIVRIDVTTITPYEDGITWGDSDCSTLYDGAKDIVYLCFCPHCKNNVPANIYKCPNCGTSLVKVKK